MNIFTELSLVLFIAAVVAGLMKVLKQPLIIGYIITGFLVSPKFFRVFHETDFFDALSTIGISILLFIVGLHLSPKVIKSVGKASLIVGLLQIIFTFSLGSALARLLGFAPTSSIYIGVCLTFSSTIVVLKLLADKGDIEKLYSGISIGVLLLQDIAACLFLIFASTILGGQSAFWQAWELAVKGILITVIMVFISRYALPKLSAFFAKSQEYLFLFSLAWGFGLASLFKFLGFSVEIGALVAGVALSLSPYADEIGAKLKPLRDFFLLLFFVLLGSRMDFSEIARIWPPVIVFSAFVLFVKPIFITFLMSVAQYNRKTAFYTGASLSQISEFSLIAALLGVSLGHIDSSLLAIVTLIALVTMTVSSYYILYADKIYPHLAKFLKPFERRKAIKEYCIIGSYEVILFGCGRVGYDFIKTFRHLGQAFLCIDFDPEIVDGLLKQNINCRYGDADDTEFLDEIGITEAKMVVSTIPDFETNKFLLSRIRNSKNRCVVILISYNIDNALVLYEAGASYVMLPHFLSGQAIAKIAKSTHGRPLSIRNERNEHITYLKERKRLGHTHPNG